MRKKQATNNKLLEELAEPLRKAYNEMASYSGLSSEERLAFKERILNTARERVKKGGLFFTETFSPEYASTVEGMEKISLFVDMRMNEEEISILHDLSGRGINVVSKDVKEGLTISKEVELVKRIEKGEALEVFSLKTGSLKSPEQALSYYLAAGKHYKTFDIATIKENVLNEHEEISEEKRLSFLATIDMIVLGGVSASLRNFERYELLRSRDYRRTLEINLIPFFNVSYFGNVPIESFLILLFIWAYETKAKKVRAEELSRLLNFPSDKFKEFLALISGTTKRMSSDLARVTNQMLVNRDEKQGLKELVDKSKALESKSPSFKKELQKLPVKKDEASKFLLEAINKHDLISLSPTALTILEVMLEQIGQNPQGFTGKVTFTNYTELANKCGVKNPEEKFSKRIDKALNDIFNASVEVVRKSGDGKKWEVMKFRIISSYSHGGNGRKTQSFQIVFTQEFIGYFLKGLSQPGKYYISNGSISAVQAFYSEGKSNFFRPEREQRSTTKNEIPSYTHRLIDTIKYMKTNKNGNNSIGKTLLLRRMGLSKYIERRRPKEAEWRLNEALAAVKEGGYYKDYSTHEGTSDGKQDLIFDFTLK